MFNNPQSAIRNPQSDRRAFTLIELLVVIAIIVALTSITLLFLPKREVRLAAQGADQLQTYIAAARSRALRDQAPRGIRLVPDTSNNFREVQLVEVPEPYAPSATMTIRMNNPTTADFTGFQQGSTLTGNVDRGDFLEIMHGGGSIHRVTDVQGTSVTLASSPPSAANADLTLTNNFRFIRQPRPLMGEPSLSLPDTVFVMPNGPATTPSASTAGSQNIPNATASGAVEIIFAPSGQVINTSAGRIVLWVKDDNNVSKPTLLTIYAHTGGVAAHPVNTRGNNPYSFTQDGKSSGQ